MNGAYLHVLLNHFPLMGLFFALCFLTIAWARGNETLKRSAFFLLIFTALMTLATKLSGDPAEAVIRHGGGVAATFIHAHEQAADRATWVVFFTAILAVVALGKSYRKPSSRDGFVPVLFVLTALSLALMGWTNHLGGKISHPEFRDDKNATLPASPSTPKQDYEIDKD